AQALGGLDVQFRIAVLSDSEKKVDFYTLNAGYPATGASYYREQTSFFDDDKLNVETHLTSTLDSLVGEVVKDRKSILLKLDTQGSELDILHGASETLKKVKAVVIEVAYTNYNLNAPKADEVIKFMEENGFKNEAVVGLVNHPLQGN